MYIHNLFIGHLIQPQAETQYQGEGSIHEVASLLITKTMKYFLFTKRPVFLLFFDAYNAFDTVVIMFLITSLYATGMNLESNNILQLRQLNLFIMITRLQQDPLNRRARHILQYKFKILCRSHVVDYRETKLRLESSLLPLPSIPCLICTPFSGLLEPTP